MYRTFRSLPGGAVVKNLPANAGDARDSGLIPGLGRSLEKEIATHSSILAWEVDRGAWWDHKELDTTEHMLAYTHTHTHTHTHIHTQPV